MIIIDIVKATIIIGIVDDTIVIDIVVSRFSVASTGIIIKAIDIRYTIFKKRLTSI